MAARRNIFAKAGDRARNALPEMIRAPSATGGTSPSKAKTPVFRPPLILRRLAFNKQTRADVWQLLADILADGNAHLSTTLDAMAEAYRAQGRTIVAGVLLDLRTAIPRRKFNTVLEQYTGTGEALIWQGYGAQDAGKIAAGAARLLRMEIALRNAILSAIAMPLLLLVGMFGLVLLFGLKLFPAIRTITDFDSLPEFHQWVIWVVSGISANPVLPVLGIGALVAMLAWALPNWHGPGRALADRVPPFSLMRLQSGAGFLFTVIEYGRAGEGVTTRLLRGMADTARPYAASRIRAIVKAYNAGTTNLGTASRQAGQGFPAPELAPILEMLWNKPDGINRAGAFVERWLERIEMTVRARMAALNVVLLALIAALLIVLMSIALPITEQLNQGLFL